jgi:hypothetical protein
MIIFRDDVEIGSIDVRSACDVGCRLLTQRYRWRHFSIPANGNDRRTMLHSEVNDPLPVLNGKAVILCPFPLFFGL